MSREAHTAGPIKHRPGPIWGCKIGVSGERLLPNGADSPMRQAVKRAFREVVGEDAEFTFSGWSASLTENEMAVVENRAPDPAEYAAHRVRAAAPALLEALREIERIHASKERSIDKLILIKRTARAAIHSATGEG